MAKFLMLGKYPLEAIRAISTKRTEEANTVVEKSGGKIDSMYALLGNYDLAFIIDFPGIAEAMKASVAITVLTGISFITLPAVPVEEFDRLVA